MNTLQEIDNKLKEFCEKSAVVNGYRFDEFTGEIRSENHDYPLFWATPVRMRIVNGQISFFVTLAIMDVQYEKSDLMKTLSDLAIIIQEVMMYIDDDSDNFMYYDVISGDFTPFSQGVDNACGWQGEIEFRVKFEAEKGTIRYK